MATVPGLMDLLKQADAEYDTAKRAELFKKAQTLMYESAWMGYIWYEKGNYVWSTSASRASPTRSGALFARPNGGSNQQS